MPELPEVETIKNDLKRAILHKKIAYIEVRDKKAVKDGPAHFLKVLRGNEFKDIGRVGKLLIFSIKRGNEDEKYLLIHLKLTGQLVYAPRQLSQSSHLAPGPHPTPLLRKERGKKTPATPFLIKGRSLNPPTPPLLKGDEKTTHAPLSKGGLRGIIAGGHPFPEVENHPTKFTRAVFRFKDGSELYFNDMRRFGYLLAVNRDELKRIEEEYGVDPLARDFQYENFKKIIQGKKVSIKAALMDQGLIAGIGNIYSDEILFAARVRPTRRANSLKENELKNIFLAIRPILKKAIKHRGTTFSDYVDGQGRQGGFSSFLKIYGKKAGEKCSVCGGFIKAIKIGGRTAKFCPKCQK